jgi:hypothetical protein
MDRIRLLIEFFKYYSAGAHLYRDGLIALLNLMYKYPNERTKSLGEWLNLFNDYLIR